MPQIIPNEEELILAIATHPKLDERCWNLFITKQHPDRSAGETLQRALYEVFPAEVNACERIAYQNEREFWDVATGFVQRGLFQKGVRPMNPAVPQIQPSAIQFPSREQPQKVLRHPNLNPWWDENTVFTEPLAVDDYLLMSHTS